MKRFMALLPLFLFSFTSCELQESDYYQVKIKCIGYPCMGWIETDDETICFTADDFSGEDGIYYYTQNLDTPDTVSIIAQGYYLSESEYTESIYVAVYENNEKVTSDSDATTISYDSGVVDAVTKAYISLDYTFTDDDDSSSE